MQIFIFTGLFWRFFVISPTASLFFQGNNGTVKFLSKAPLEIIEAKSSALNGIIDAEMNTFAWIIDIKTFQGFNGPLQREHFNENYLESNVYPRASFTGKIIEAVNYRQNGTYTIRAKGKLTIHGVTQERIIKSRLDVRGNVLHIESVFTVALADHNITIPKVVHQKIAEQIEVSISADLTEKP